MAETKYPRKNKTFISIDFKFDLQARDFTFYVYDSLSAFQFFSGVTFRLG